MEILPSIYSSFGMWLMFRPPSPLHLWMKKNIFTPTYFCIPPNIPRSHFVHSVRPLNLANLDFRQVQRNHFQIYIFHSLKTTHNMLSFTLVHRYTPTSTYSAENQSQGTFTKHAPHSYTHTYTHTNTRTHTLVDYYYEYMTFITMAFSLLTSRELMRRKRESQKQWISVCERCTCFTPPRPPPRPRPRSHI